MDILWGDLVFGFASCFWSKPRSQLSQKIERFFSPIGEPESDSEASVCLSIRSGFDLYLEVLNLEPGSEVLVSALTIPDMWRILEDHGLVPVPVDVDPLTLAPKPESLEKALSSKTKAVLVAHLFGTRMNLSGIAEFSRRHALFLWEDCAQAFSGLAYTGDPRAAVSMFSFGPIKTATALGGGVLIIRDKDLRHHWRQVHARYPAQSERSFFSRVLKYALIKALTNPVAYGAFFRICYAFGKSPDAIIQRSVRGFSGDDFYFRIRHQPSRALLSLLLRRIRDFDEVKIQKRAAAMERVIDQLGERDAFPGAYAPERTHWVSTMLCGEPVRLVERLRIAGFDATQVATLKSVPAPRSRPDLKPKSSEGLLGSIVYLPVNADLPISAVDRLIHLLRQE
ncbi:hypothetical protein EBZ37_03440 [bacterium]|nr:hypothetical protein [bacterium]